MFRAFSYFKMPKWIRIATKDKKAIPMNSQGLVECRICLSVILPIASYTIHATIGQRVRPYHAYRE